MHDQQAKLTQAQCGLGAGHAGIAQLVMAPNLQPTLKCCHSSLDTGITVAQ